LSMAGALSICSLDRRHGVGSSEILFFRFSRLAACLEPYVACSTGCGLRALLSCLFPFLSF
jgi:hypothetical protein